MKQKLDDLFGIDVRSLALLRIGLAAAVLCDLAFRAPNLIAHHTDQGVLPAAVAREVFGGGLIFSVHHHLSGSVPAVILLFAFGGSALFLQILLMFTRVNILKVIVLAGTFALAMAFAANDLVNFIGVPLAGLSAYDAAQGSENLLGGTMEALIQPVRANTLFLLASGAVMVVTLWVSRKTRGVSRTELSLGRQDEGYERFESTVFSRAIVRVGAALFKNVSRVVPRSLKLGIANRLDRAHFRPVPAADGTVRPFAGETAIFITPGYRFKVVDVLVSNFHLPRSTLFMLVSAFAGLERMKTVYAHAREKGYRFYSYGDSSLLFRSDAG